jgi:hypothetical protein
MVQPNTIFSGTTGPSGDRPGPDRIATRAAMYLVLIVVFPVAVIVYLTWVGLNQWARMPYKVPLLAGLAFFLGGLIFGGFSADSVAFFLSGYVGWASSAGFPFDNLASYLPQILLGQLWPGLLIGTVLAGVGSAWKWARRPRYQEKFITPGPVLNARLRKTEKQIAEGSHSPTNGITLGVALDTRDARFAGGEPGARYGDRVVIEDKELAGHAFVVGGSGSGKALALDTPIPTPNGFVNMGDLKPGDLVFGRDGKPITVTGAYDVMTEHQCYEVVFSDGSSITADADHLWTVETIASRKAERRRVDDSSRAQGGSQAEIAAVRAALNAAVPGDLITAAEMAALLNRSARAALSFAYLTLTSLIASRTVRVGVVQSYAGQLVHKPRTANGYEATDALRALLARLERFPKDQRNIRTAVPETVTTREMVGSFRAGHGKFEYSIPLVDGPVEFLGSQALPLEPYLLGLHLGDGGTDEASFTTADRELLDAWTAGGFTYRKIDDQYRYYIYGLRPVLRKMGVLGHKHIPDEYLFSSVEVRRALLAGLLDTDGAHERGARVSHTTKLKELADQVSILAASLGYMPTQTQRMVKLPDGRLGGPYYTTGFSSQDPVFRLHRKEARHAAVRTRNNGLRHARRFVVDIRPVASVPVRCIAVDSPDHLFLAGHRFIATHNTQTMLTGLRDVIRLGRGVVFIDCKGGPDVPEQIEIWARRYGREFLHWTIQDPAKPYQGPAEKPAFYDPISRGDASRRKDLLIGAMRWDVEYYKSVISNYLQTLFMVKDLVPPLEGTDTFTDVSDLLSPAALSHRARYISAGDHPELAATLNRLNEIEDGERSGIRNMYARLHTITSSTAGAWLRSDPEGLRDIDLRRVADEGQVVVFSLDTSNYEETAGLIAGLIVQDLKTLSSELRHDPATAPLHVYVDEFSAVDTTNLLGLLSKARDAKMPCTLATQALADLARREPTFTDQVLGIVSTFIIHRANAEADARIYAGLSGVVRKTIARRNVEESTGAFGVMGASSSTGIGFLEERDEYAVHVGAFQELKTGTAIFIVKSPKARYVNPVRVIVEGGQLGPYAGDPAVEIKQSTYIRVPVAPKHTYPHPTAVALGQQQAPENTPSVGETLERSVDLSSAGAGPLRPARPDMNPLTMPISPGGTGGPRVPGRPAGAPMPSVRPSPIRPSGRDDFRPDEWSGIP